MVAIIVDEMQRNKARKGYYIKDSMAVFVFNKKKQPMMPTSEKRARLLLEKGRAVVIKTVPFTIRLKDRIQGEVH